MIESLEALRHEAMAKGMQLYILVHPDACPVCAMHRGKIYWADEAPTLPIGGCLKHDCKCEYRPYDPNGPTLDEMLKNGVDAVKARKLDTAQEWLVALLQIDRFNEQAWLWLSGATDDDQDRLDCLTKVIEINPNNVSAQRGLATLHARGVGVSLPAGEPDETG